MQHKRQQGGRVRRGDPFPRPFLRDGGEGSARRTVPYPKLKIFRKKLKKALFIYRMFTQFFLQALDNSIKILYNVITVKQQRSDAK